MYHMCVITHSNFERILTSIKSWLKYKMDKIKVRLKTGGANVRGRSGRVFLQSVPSKRRRAYVIAKHHNYTTHMQHFQRK